MRRATSSCSRRSPSASRAELRLLEVNRRKDEFLATLAHELRNPLASLGNALNALQLAERTEPLHEAMQRQLRLLVRLIDDLLDIARINRGKLTVQHAPTTLRAVLDSAIETAMPLLLADRHTLDVRVPDDEIALYVDHDRLSQVFSNLLNNAAKYSPAETPIELVARSDADGIDVAVIDSGIGLDAGQADEIFEAFAQVDTSLERSRGGLGIGLTLVKRIVELHDGRVDVHSEGLGRGSRFTVHLPLVPVPREAAAAPPAVVETGTNASCRALIVDDNHDSADTHGDDAEDARPRNALRLRSAPDGAAPSKRSSRMSCSSTSACPGCPATTSRARCARPRAVMS